MVGLAVGPDLCDRADGAGWAAANGLAAGAAACVAGDQRGELVGGRGGEDSRGDCAGGVAARARLGCGCSFAGIWTRRVRGGAGRSGSGGCGGGGFGDEPVVIAQRAGVPVWVGAERFAAGEAAEGLSECGGAQQVKSEMRDLPSAALRVRRQPDLRMTNHACICWMMGFSIGGWRGRWMWCW